MHSFNTEERTSGRVGVKFEIGDQTFTTRGAVRPDVIALWEVETGTGNPVEQLAAADKLICEFLIPADAARWLEMRQRDDDPNSVLTIADIDEMIRWLVQEASGRPTKAPPSSSSGEPSGADSSKGGSSSAEATPTA